MERKSTLKDVAESKGALIKMEESTENINIEISDISLNANTAKETDEEKSVTKEQELENEKKSANDEESKSKSNASVGDTQTEFVDIWHAQNAFLDRIYGIKFPYLTDLYQRYKDEGDNNYIGIAKEIYSEFIDDDAIHVCNLSAQTRLGISEFIQNLDDKADGKDPTQIEQYLVVFNPAILEIWNLMNSVFNFQYRQHLKKKNR